MTSNTCDRCRHAFHHPEDHNLYCRRYPKATSIVLIPRQNLAGQIMPVPQILSAFPIMAADEVCGEWAPELSS